MTENCISLINAGLEDKKTAQGIFIEKILYVSYHLGHVEMEKKEKMSFSCTGYLVSGPGKRKTKTLPQPKCHLFLKRTLSPLL